MWHPTFTSNPIAWVYLFSIRYACVVLITYSPFLLALYMDLSVGVTPSDVHTVSQTTLLPADYTNNRLNLKWGTNIPYLKDPLNIMNFPNNAYLAVGTSAFRLVSGRGKVEWGNGVLGNMVIGNTLPYHDYISLTFNGSNKFTYQLLSSFFSHSVNKLNNIII